MSEITNEIKKRRTFAIISHPDAGKDNVDGKISIIWRGDQSGRFCQKGKATSKHAVSDWMEKKKKEVFRLLLLYCSLITMDTVLISLIRRGIRISRKILTEH